MSIAMNHSWSDVLGNPLLVKSIRSRLRLLPLIAWGLITVSIASFMYLVTYLSTLERGLLQHEEAAKTALLPLIFLQGVLLMVMGTGAVASGFARERAEGLLDYHRLTPMSPTSKIVGYMFGLPIREYVLFGLTLPFVIYSMVRGEMSPWRLVVFYSVFFTATWVYHMTGMVAGMCAKRPWRAQMTSMGMVFVLYLALPQLGNLGFTFFEFLTVRPTFYAMVAKEVRDVVGGVDVFWRLQIARWEQVDFFNFTVSPVLFSMLVQAFVLGSMFLVVYRKWLGESRHPFSKSYAIFCGAAVMTLLIGSLWPILTRAEKFNQWFAQISRMTDLREPLYVLLIILIVLLAVSGFTGGLLIQLVSPSSDTVRAGLRRARKMGSRHLPWNSDAATGLFVTLVMIALTFVGYGVILAAARRNGSFFNEPLPLWVAWSPPALVALLILFMQLLREVVGGRAFAFLLFVVWVIPIFAQVIAIAAFEREVLATYLGMPSPATGLYLTCANVIDHAAGDERGLLYVLSESLRLRLGTLIGTCLGMYAVGVLLLGVMWQQERARLRREELGT